MAISALLIEDNLGDARLIREMLRDHGAGQPLVELTHVDRLADGLERVRQPGVDAVLLDLSLPDSSGLETFAAVHAAAPTVPVVVLSGLADEGVAVQAVHDGAQDYLVKGNVDGATIVRSLRYAIERQRLETARLDLERQRDEFFSSVSHDLRTPVAAIKAAVGVVLANEPANMPPPLHRLLGNIDLAADELARLIDDLLEVARLQAGRVELWKSSVELSSVVERCIASMESLFAARDQRLVFETAGEAEVHIDVERFSRVLRNLLGNAQKYGRDGGTVRVSIERSDEGVCLVVADDGPGIAPEDHERIFERFHRLSTMASGTPGTGLGLAIARGIVELHGGRLSVESSLGQGATFIISLPPA